MRVLRGRGEDRATDRAITRDLLALTASTGSPGVRVWRPHRQLAFGRRDVHAPGYDRAREIANDRGFPPVERRVGGRAVAVTASTVMFAVTEPVDDTRRGIENRYEAAATAVQRALWRLGVPAQRGEPDGAFCPGTRSLSWKGKIAGIGQRVEQDAALTAGLVIVDGHESIADVLAPVYGALDLAFDPDAVGSVARAGGRAKPDAVRETIETLLVGARDVEVEEVAAG